MRAAVHGGRWVISPPGHATPACIPLHGMQAGSPPGGAPMAASADRRGGSRWGASPCRRDGCPCIRRLHRDLIEIPMLKWLKDTVGDRRVIFRSTSPMVQLNAVRRYFRGNILHEASSAAFAQPRSQRILWQPRCLRRGRSRSDRGELAGIRCDEARESCRS